MRRRTRREVLGMGATTLGSLIAGCSSQKEEPMTSDTDTATESKHFTLPPPAPTATAPKDPKPLDVSSDWHQFRYDAGNTGHPHDQTALLDGGEVYWHYAGVVFPPVVAEGSLYAVEQGQRGGYLVAREAETGSHRWTVAFDDVATSPIVVDDVVVLQTKQKLFAFDRHTGSERWSQPLDRGEPRIPVVDDGAVYCGTGGRDGSGGTVFSVTAADGTRNWSADFDEGIQGTLAVGEHSIFFVTDDGVLRVHDTVAGGERWTATLGTSARGTVTVKRQRVFAATRKAVHAFRTSGVKRWKTPVQSVHDAPTIAGNDLFVGTASGVTKLRLKDGRQQWHFGTSGPMTTASVGSDAVYFGGRTADDPTMYVADRQTGRKRWHYQFGSETNDAGLRGAPVLVENGLFVAAKDGMYAFGPHSGSGTPATTRSAANRSATNRSTTTRATTPVTNQNG